MNLEQEESEEQSEAGDQNREVRQVSDEDEEAVKELDHQLFSKIPDSLILEIFLSLPIDLSFDCLRTQMFDHIINNADFKDQFQSHRRHLLFVPKVDFRARINTKACKSKFKYIPKLYAEN